MFRYLLDFSVRRGKIFAPMEQGDRIRRSRCQIRLKKPSWSQHTEVFMRLISYALNYEDLMLWRARKLTAHALEKPPGVMGSDPAALRKPAEAEKSHRQSEQPLWEIKQE